MSSPRITERIAVYVEDQNKLRTRDTSDREAALKKQLSKAEGAERRQIQEELAKLESAKKNELKRSDIKELKFDINGDRKQDSVFVDATRYDKLTPEAVLANDAGVVAVEANRDFRDDTGKLAAGSPLDNAAKELGVKFKEGSKAEKDVTYKGWSSREIERPPEFVKDFEYMKKYEEAYPGGKWLLAAHENQGTFARYYAPKDLAPSGMPFQETSIVRPDKYGNKKVDDLSKAGQLVAEDAQVPEGKFGQEAARFTHQLLEPSAAARDRTKAYEIAQNHLKNADGEGRADTLLKDPNQLRKELKSSFEMNGLPVAKVDDFDTTMNTVDKLLSKDATLFDQRDAYEIAINTVAGKCHENGQLESQLKQRFGDLGLPLADANANANAANAGPNGTSGATPATPADVKKANREAYTKSLQALEKDFDVLSKGGDKVSHDTLVKAANEGAKWKDKSLSAEGKDAIRFLLSNPKALNDLDTRERGGDADKVFTKGDLQMAQLKAKEDPAWVDTLDLKEPPSKNLTPEVKRKHLDAIKDNLAALDSKGEQGDGIFALKDVGRVLEDSNISPELREALVAFVSDKSFFDGVDGANGGGRPDGKFAVGDLDKALAQVNTDIVRGQLKGRSFDQHTSKEDKFLAALDTLSKKENIDVLRGNDHIFSREELQTVARGGENATFNGKKVSPELRQAAAFLVTNPDLLDKLDGADGGGKVDGVFALKDIEVALGNAATELMKKADKKAAEAKPDAKQDVPVAPAPRDPSPLPQGSNGSGTQRV